MVVLSAACRESPESAQSVVSRQSAVISSSGAVGPLQIGVSTERDVRASLGAPEAVADDNFQFPGAPQYRALGYQCSSRPSGHRRALVYSFSKTGRVCRTVYYINLRAGVLGSFWTSSPTFRTSSGTRVGMSTTIAETHEHKRAAFGCHVGFLEQGRAVTLLLSVENYAVRPLHPGRNDHLAYPAGGRVVDIAVDGNNSGVGLLFC